MVWVYSCLPVSMGHLNERHSFKLPACLGNARAAGFDDSPEVGGHVTGQWPKRRLVDPFDSDLPERL